MNRANRPRQPRISGSSYASRALSRAGDGSTLSLDFTTGVLDPRLTFTRSTTGTYINSSGYVTSAAIDVPRFDYDPTTLTPRGLLIEGSATNYLPGSQTLSGLGWSTGGTVVRTINYATGPDNVALSATRLVMSFSGGNGRIYYSSAYTTLPHTSSVWLKSNTGSNQTLNLWNTNGVGVTCTVTPQWQRFQSVSTAGTSLPGYFYLENPSTVTGVDILAWGAQLEPGLSSTSYIPTVASTGTRAQDNAIISAGAAFSGWYTGGLNGTFYADWYAGVAGASATQRTVLATDDVTAKHLHLYQTATTNTMTLANFGGGSTLATSNAISPAGARAKSAFSYATSAMNICLNGGTVASGTVTGFTVAPTWLSLGGPSTNGTSITGTTVMLNSSIRAIKYWPTVLPNTTLQSLTA